MTESEILTSGMVGKQVKLKFSPEWDGLQKIVVFTAGDVTRDMLWQGDAVKIPHEVLAQPLRRLRVGVYGVSGDGTLVIPTVRALGPEIQPGANPTDDPGTEPTLEVWAQMQMQLGDLALLDTDAKESLVAAVNELAQSKGDGVNQEAVSATHEWDGTVLKITSASGTSSADLKGPKGDTGATGATGAAGYTPVRGTDYWTEADKAEIVAAVIESLGGNPVFGYVDEHNNIIVSGSLADGTYSVKYEMEDGSTVDIGDLVLDSNVYYSVTNNLTDCISNNSATQAVQGGSYSATITANSGYELSSIKVTMGGTDISSTAVSGGNISIADVTGNIVITAVATEIVVTPTYTNLFDPSKATINYRYNSSGALTAQDGYVAINIDGIGDYMPFTADTKIYMKGASFNDGEGKARINTFNTIGEDTSSTNRVSSINYNNMTFTDEGNGVESVSGVADSFVSGIVRMAICPKVSSSAITADDIANIIITIGEPIL